MITLIPELTAAIVVPRSAEALSNMEEIRIRLWRDEKCQDWHVEINGLRHMHVSSQSLEDLIEAAVIRAEHVIEQATLRGLRPN